MSLLLVDDRDGRIVAEVDTQEEAERILSAWAAEDGSIPPYLCLVQIESRHGSIIGTDTTVKIRPLPSL